jgi:hypothetical protein
VEGEWGCKSYGCLFLGRDVLEHAWPLAERVFAIDPKSPPSRAKTSSSTTEGRYQNILRINWKRFWKQHAMPQVLVVARPKQTKLDLAWETNFLDSGLDIGRPEVIVTLERLTTLLQAPDSHKAQHKRMNRRGYHGILQHLDSSRCGAATWGSFLVTFWVPSADTTSNHMTVLRRELGTIGLTPRGFENCLKPVGVARQSYVRKGKIHECNTVRENHLGVCHGSPVIDPIGPIILDPDAIIPTPKGLRRLELDEWMKIKGLPPDLAVTKAELRNLVRMPGVQEWSAVGDRLMELDLSTKLPFPTASLPETPEAPTSVFDFPEPEGPWSWEVPDLSEGSQFFEARLARLHEVVAELHGPDAWITDGLIELEKHRTNYGITGPQNLAILWWEWPREHWEELREGASMNFMETPPPGLVENTEMTAEEHKIACNFVDELHSLGVVGPSTEKILNNCPIFTVPKPGQPDQYRCIADGKRGNINDSCAADPVQMTCPDDILPALYPGGYSAVVDASKYFHMFKTRKDEYKHLGIIHPNTGEILCYYRFPMGTRNSPGASGRFGAAFLREVIRTSPDFQGTVTVVNDFTSGWNGEGYNPALGIGRVLISEDGQPAVLIWIHVDDILLHGPTYAKTRRALDHVLAVATRLGLICHPTKTKPPSQIQKFCGFIYDTVSIPCRRLPADKEARAISLIRFLRHEQRGPLAALTLSVVVGYLQSLVPATPSNIGAVYLRELYDCLYSQLDPNKTGTTQAFYSQMSISPQAFACLDWWERAIQRGLACTVQVRDESTGVVTWGDGSGTGSGGSVDFIRWDFVKLGPSEDWMGSWDGPPGESSNWRELRTLLEVLKKEDIDTSRYRGKRVLYFTDNMVSYDIVRRGSSKNPALHALVRELKLLDLMHGCTTVVIHVPGLVMIQQGTDGLSRGIWRSPLAIDHSFDLRLLFAPVPNTPDIFKWACTVAGIPACDQHLDQWTRQLDHSDWSDDFLIQRWGFWTVRPSLGRQAMTAAVKAWVESPLDSQHLFILPRILQRSFGRVHKNIEFFGQHDPFPLPAFEAYLGLTPVLVFHLPKFRRQLSVTPCPDPDGMELPPLGRLPRWIARQVTHVRGLR